MECARTSSHPSYAVEALLALPDIPIPKTGAKGVTSCFKICDDGTSRYYMIRLDWPPRNSVLHLWDLVHRPPVIVPGVVVETLETLFVPTDNEEGVECQVVASVLVDMREKHDLVLVFSIDGEARAAYYDFQMLEMLC